MTYQAENRPAAKPDAIDPPLPPAPSIGSPAVFEPDPTPPPATETERHHGAKVERTRTSAVWVGVWAGVVVLILLIIFVAQNTAKVDVAFFALEGRIPIALALLIAGVAGAVIAMAIAAARIIQLRRQVRRGR